MSVLVIDKLAARVTKVLGVDPVQAGAVPVQAGSPPLLAVTVFVPAVAVAATLMGTLITMLPTGVPAAITQLLMFTAPAAGQALSEPPVAVITPLVVMPVGKASARVIGVVVALPDTAIVMV